MFLFHIDLGLHFEFKICSDWNLFVSNFPISAPVRRFEMRPFSQYCSSPFLPPHTIFTKTNHPPFLAIVLMKFKHHHPSYNLPHNSLILSIDTLAHEILPCNLMDLELISHQLMPGPQLVNMLPLLESESIPNPKVPKLSTTFKKIWICNVKDFESVYPSGFWNCLAWKCWVYKRLLIHLCIDGLFWSNSRM